MVGLLFSTNIWRGIKIARYLRSESEDGAFGHLKQFVLTYKQRQNKQAYSSCLQ
jgi:hypothetical protein